jgi:uncharacterized membrane protein
MCASIRSDQYKQREAESGSGKFEHIRFILVLVLAGLSCFTLYISKHQRIQHLEQFLFAFMGRFLAASGNFFPSLKADHFIGIRSPRTLENEQVWGKTHPFAGWVAGGLLLILPAFIPGIAVTGEITVSLMLCLALIPFLYSYLPWRRWKKDPRHLLNLK